MLPSKVREFSLKLNNLLHSSITDSRTLHLVSFLSFLEAALNMRGKRGRHLKTLERIKELIENKSAQSAVQSLLPKAAAVLEEVKRGVERASVAEEANVSMVIRETAGILRGEVNNILVIDAFSIIEFAALLVKCWRSQLSCELVESEIFVNPRGNTWYVKRQVGEGNTGYLRDYAAKLAREIGCGRSFEVYPLFDKALHFSVGDVICFLEGEEGNPFELAWGKIQEILQREQTLFPFCLLLTSDHGYNVLEDESGTLYVEHGREERAVLRLDRVSLFALIRPRSGI